MLLQLFSLSFLLQRSHLWVLLGKKMTIGDLSSSNNTFQCHANFSIVILLHISVLLCVEVTGHVQHDFICAFILYAVLYYVSHVFAAYAFYQLIKGVNMCWQILHI